MYTLNEIKSVVYNEKLDVIGMLKDLLKLTMNEGKLLTFNGIYLCKIGDPSLYINGVALVNDKLLCHAYDEYGGDVDSAYIATLTNEDVSCNRTKGIGISDEVFKKVCQIIIENHYGIEFDFLKMEAVDRFRICSGLLEENYKKSLIFKEDLDSLINGEKNGYVEY